MDIVERIVSGAWSAVFSTGFAALGVARGGRARSPFDASAAGSGS
jgi:hypothetical protein